MSKAMKKGNMYEDAIERWNVVVGCYFSCKYCLTSFQAQMKRQMPTIDKNGKKRGCQDCYDYIPHFHEKRLKTHLPKTTGDQFIWCCSSSDIYFARAEWIEQILDVVRKYDDRTFFFQSKSPSVFYNHAFPENVILGCYDAKTRVLTTEGFKTYSEVKEGDEVFSLDSQKRVKHVKVKKVLVYPYEGDMIKFKGRSIDLLVTPNHQMLTLTRKSQTAIHRNLKFKRAIDITNQALICFPNGSWSINKQKTIKIDNNEIPLEDIAYLMGIYIGDGWSGIGKTKHINKTSLSREEYYERMRGRNTQYLNLSKNPLTTYSPYTRIYLCIPEGNKARKRVIDTLARNNINHSLYDNMIYIGSTEWYTIFDKCGHGAKRKTIPRWILNEGRIVLKNLFDGLMDSDGCERRKYVTISPYLLAPFEELCIKLGLNAHISKRIHKGNILASGRRIKGGSYYSISVGHVIRNLTSKNISRIPYKGVVWCLSVGETKNFLVERNGTSVFCGNSTLETNRNYPNISKAPEPYKRYKDFLKLDHPRKAVTIEPIMEFDLFPFITMIRNISPERVYIGYDSRRSNLNEPLLAKTNRLITCIETYLPSCKVKTKLMREKYDLNRGGK